MDEAKVNLLNMNTEKDQEIEGEADAEPKFSQEFVEKTPEVLSPPIVPDVELIVDGFGTIFDIKDATPSRNTSKNRFETTALTESTEGEGEGKFEDKNIVRRYTWKTKNRMTVQVISYGATITSVKVPDRKGVPDDVVAGFDDLEGYLNVGNPYFGATIGRYANIIKDGTMNVKPSGKMYMLSTNFGRDHYHGGFVGLDKVNWRSYHEGTKVTMAHISESGEEGYPGSILVRITFDVTVDNTLKVRMRCATTEPTIVNLSCQPYFNLAGHHSGPNEVMEHIITINADKYIEVDETRHVTGKKKVVGGTELDFRVPRMLKHMIPKMPLGGYDITMCVTRGVEQDLAFVARAIHPGTGRVLEIYSDQPGVHFYTGNKLPNPNGIIESESGVNEASFGSEASVVKSGVDENDRIEMSEKTSKSSKGMEEASDQGVKGLRYVPLNGKGGTIYIKHGLFCLSTQNYPDAVNHGNFPNSVLNPDEKYEHKIDFKFGLLLGKYV